MRARSFVFAVVVLVCSFPVCADEVLLVPVQLRPDVSAEVAVHVVMNPERHSKGVDVLLVHGLAQTGATFRPLADALFDESLGRKVGRVYIAELPGHGASPLPVGMLFGDLAIEDYATAILGVLDAVPADVVVGHSMGAVVVQSAQQRLITAGSNLRDSYGVRGVALIAPVIPEPIDWAFVDSGTAAGILGSFVTVDPIRGLIVDIPPLYWVGVFYGDRSGNVPAGAPTPAEVVANGYSSPEAFIAGAQTVRLFFAPTVSRGIFDERLGTVAGIVSLEQDALFANAEHEALYEYLTGDSQPDLFFVISGSNAVHNMHTFAPQALLHPIKRVINAIEH